VGVNVLATACRQQVDYLGLAILLGDFDPEQQAAGRNMLIQRFGVLLGDRFGGKSAEPAANQSSGGGGGNG
jgi:hypothetical protein